MNEAELLQRLAQGDQAALAEIVGLHGPRVRRYLGMMLPDRSWADELTQETFVRLFDKAASFDGSRDLPVWLFAIARNLAVDLWRRERRRWRALASFDAVAEPADRRAGPPEQLASSEFRSAFETAVAQLPERFRSVFVLKEIERLSYARIALVLETSVKTVSSRLHRARLRLQRSLARYLEP